MEVDQVSEGNTLARMDSALAQTYLNDDMHADLLRSIAEQLKLPLMHIARQAEFYKNEETLGRQTLSDMQLNADMAIRLVDGYILGLDLATSQLDLELEPVSLSSTLYDVAHDLTPVAKQYNCEVQLLLAGKYGQVMAHKEGLNAAIYSIGLSLIELDTPENLDHKIKLIAHHSPQGIITGVYVDRSVETPKVANANNYQIKMRQPFADVTAQNGVGVFMADAILSSMNTKLRVGKFRDLHGLAMTLKPNKQLQLI